MAMTDLRSLPAVHALLASPDGQALAAAFGAGCATFALRHALDAARQAAKEGAAVPPAGQLLAEARAHLQRLREPAARRAINATGILLHTGLGRAPMSEAATAAIAAATGATPIQADIDSGARSLREERVEELLCALTGCEAATVVNNNAAATMLVLAAVAAGKEVPVSRGQLVEIGGAFRLPDVMRMSGCILKEVGTTNRTHLRDYEQAIGEQTGCLLHVHTSNYRVRGFASTPGIAELCELGRARGLPVIDDLGSGALLPLAPYGLADEPLVADSVRAGAELCCFSSDKLIGGPQGGIILGRKAWIERLRKHPFGRMFRVCKLSLAGLEATLCHFLNGEQEREIPFYRMLARPLAAIRTEAERLAAACTGLPLAASAVEAEAFVGSGSLPDQAIPSAAVRLVPEKCSADALGRRLRRGQPAVFTRLADGAVLCDCRTLQEGEGERLLSALRTALG